VELAKKTYNKFTDIPGNFDEGQYVQDYRAVAAHERVNEMFREQAR